MSMNKKRVLMFCASFFGYDTRIADAIRDKGYEVDLHDERASNSFVGKACIRYNVSLYRPVIRRYVQSIVAQNTGNQYDYVLVINGEGITEDALGLLRAAYPDARFILYLWDSVANIPDCERRMKLYDRVLTFDPTDAKKHEMLFRPLFFGKEYEASAQTQTEYPYDFAFIGTAHTVRPLIVKKLARACAERGGASFAYLFLPHPMVYLYNKVLNRAYRDVKWSDIRFAPMNARQITEVYRKSRCILDVEHQKQSGLTMRTIELVGMQKKIITTNRLVREYDFYNPSNICIIDREAPSVEDGFWESVYEPIPEEILRRYSLDSFIKEILEIKE